jgi:acyl carrier protein
MSRDEIERALRRILREKFTLDDVDRHAVFGEAYDLDSIDSLEMLGAMEDELGIVLTQPQKKALFQERTLDSIVGFLDRVLNAPPTS